MKQLEKNDDADSSGRRDTVGALCPGNSGRKEEEEEKEYIGKGRLEEILYIYIYNGIFVQVLMTITLA